MDQREGQAAGKEQGMTETEKWINESLKNLPHLCAEIRRLSEENDALRAQQERNDWICTLKCKALMDEGVCEHGGLCCLYESQRVIEQNTPLTLDELRGMNGEPVWVIAGAVSWWDIVSFCGEKYLYLTIEDGLPLDTYGEWLAYRHKPEEGTR